jgi:hypothetical protein
MDTQWRKMLIIRLFRRVLPKGNRQHIVNHIRRHRRGTDSRTGRAGITAGFCASRCRPSSPAATSMATPHYKADC